jgi:hypothetical protein
MRFFFKLILLILFGLPLTLAAAVFLAVDTQPTIERAAEVTPSSIERAKRILGQNDPRKLKPGERRTVTVSSGDLDLAANYLAHRYGGGSARVVLQNGSARFGASLTVPRLPVSLYLNLDATLVEQTPLPQLEALRVGRLPVPSWIVHWAIANGPRALGFNVETESWNKIIRQMVIRERSIAVTYEWQENTLKSLRAIVIPPADRKRIAIYQDLLVSVSQKYERRTISLVDLLVPFFQLARERTPHSDAIDENRAAILVLAFYVNGKSFEQVLPELKSRQPQAQPQVLLNQRDDFAKHFIVSAAFAASSGSPLADAVGLYKEIADSRGGSGFSFNDIAADRAGVRFGESAAKSAMAKQLQAKVGAGIIESDLMPATADLPEFMPETEFKRRFGGVDGVEYKKMMAEIERRVAALPLYR